MNNIVRIFRLVTATLLSVVAITISIECNAQTVYTSDEINKAILLPGSIEPEWIQDEANPWRISGENMDKLYTPNSTGTLSIICKFKSDYPVIFQYKDFLINLYDGNTNKLIRLTQQNAEHYNIIKLEAGEHFLKFECSYSNRYISNLGIFEIKDDIDASAVMTSRSKPFVIVNDSITPWALADNQIISTRTGGLQGQSTVTLKFTTDKITSLSWEYCDNSENSFSKRSITTEYGMEYDTPSYHRYLIYDNDESFYSDLKYSSTSGLWRKAILVLEPGDHEIKITEDLWADNNTNGFSNQSSIRNIELNDEWFTVDVIPGDLGNSVIDEISKYGYAYLTDVEMLKVKGPLNASDWDRIYQMTNLKALDLQETDIVDFPASAFKDNRTMSYILLPNGLKTIGDYAFKNSNIKYLYLPSGLKTIGSEAFNSCRIRDLKIPASVEKINFQAFANTWIRTLAFEPESNLNILGACAFYGCSSLRGSVELPDVLTNFETVGSRYETYYDSGSNFTISAAFSGCTNITSIKFPKSLKSIPASICYDADSLANVILPEDLESIEYHAFQGCNSLNYISLPESMIAIGEYAFSGSQLKELNLPESIKRISTAAFRNNLMEEVSLPLNLEVLGTDAFKNCVNLKKIRLHSGATYLPNFLTDCASLETIVLPCATPPTRSGDDILGTQDKKKINLIVPDFAVSSYRLDDYWYTYGAINSGEEADNVNYWNVIGKLTMREGRRMQGTPDVNIAQGGGMMVLGTTPATINSLTINNSETAPAPFVNSCDAFKANDISVNFHVDANKWYFFTPAFDVNVEDIVFSADCAYALRYYDGDSRAQNGKGASWKDVDSATLSAGTGYIIQCDKACDMIFKETSASDSRILSTEPIEVALISHDSENVAHANWNLIGNPYPSYYDIWYMDVDVPITVYENNTYRALSITDDNYALRPMQAFFIQKPAEEATALFNTEGRQINSTISTHRNAPARRVAPAKRAIFNIELSDTAGNICDRTRVVINNNASEQYEMRCDAAKFMSAEKNVPQLYTIDGNGTRLAINERPLGSGSVDLGITTGSDMEYIISASRADGRILLVDDATGTMEDISDAPCSLFLSKESTVDRRLHLEFVPFDTTSAEQNMIAKASAYSAQGTITIKNPGAEKVAVYSADGLLIFSDSAIDASVDVHAGIYVVRIGNRTFKLLVK